MSPDERFAELWTDYLEGELDGPGLTELSDLLAADAGLVERAADLFQTHRLLGLISEEEPARQDHFVRDTLQQLPAAGDAFVSHVMSEVRSRAERRATGQFVRPSGATARSEWRIVFGLRQLRWIAAAAAVVLIGSLAFWLRSDDEQPIATDKEAPQQDPAAQVNVRLASSSQAKFFGELPPPVGSLLEPRREYVLTSGLVQIAFPDGASAILDGPAVFRVISPQTLALDMGRCSVHAPDGAEGFRVETPVTRVVDRGTRFSVSVGETSDTEVQIIEGAADIYGHVNNIDASSLTEVRLTDGEARRFASAGRLTTETVPFDATTYRRQLPDRVVSYVATKAADGGAEILESVTVQRGGRVVQIPVDELIPARLVWFRSKESRAFLCGGATLPASRADAVSDRSLITGVINPDGSRDPLTADPVMESGSGTPGLAIRFQRPVINGPGADVVLFDVQTFGNPPDGDAFHVSPLSFRDGLTSHTIRRYDLTMESPEAQVLTGLYVCFFKERVDSMAQLESLEYSMQKQGISFRGLAVGIDLSDMGYDVGEAVEGLFIQDAMDDNHHVDPVFIAGLPEKE
ncbi:MAG: FecR family protein [Fuerstiella sp.]